NACINVINGEKGIVAGRIGRVGPQAVSGDAGAGNVHAVIGIIRVRANLNTVVSGVINSDAVGACRVGNHQAVVGAWANAQTAFIGHVKPDAGVVEEPVAGRAVVVGPGPERTVRGVAIEGP